MSARTVAFIAPDFPPSSLPSSIRARLFASHLAEFGWHPIVITAKPEQYQAPLDSENERLLPPDLEIVRTDALPYRWMRRFGVGDIGMRSLWHHWLAIKTVSRTRRIDLVFITVPPSVPMILGRVAHARLGLPYVVDYQDPWITEVYWRMPRSERPPKWPLAYAMARILEPIALRRVSHVTGVSEGTTRDVLARYPKLNVKSTALPFGAEPADFRFLREHPRPNRFFNPNDGLLHVVYAGVCIPGMYPALQCLFGGVRILRERNGPLASRLRLHFIGTNYASGGAADRVMPIANEFGIADIVSETPGRVAYLDSLQLMLDATALLILGTDEPHYTSSKIYPCALSGRPILAILNEQSSGVGSLRALAPARILILSDPPELAAEQLEAVLSDPAHVPVEADIAPHTARAMTQKLAAIFDSVVEDGPSRKRK